MKSRQPKKVPISSDVLRRWFNAFHSFGIILPDRWFGRPGDNIHHLNNIVLEGDFLLLDIDQGYVKFEIQGGYASEPEHGVIQISDFSNIKLNTLDYANGKPLLSRVYHSGELEFEAR